MAKTSNLKIWNMISRSNLIKRHIWNTSNLCKISYFKNLYLF